MPIQDLGINGKDAQPAKTVDKDGNAIPEPSADFLQEALREQMKRDKKAGKDDGVDMTPEEAKNFEKAFQEPEFRKLMAEYVSEISDPKNRAEQDAYIRQLEGQGEVPEDKEIIRPTPHYTVKFKHVKTAIKNHAIAEDKPWEKTKMFLNVVSSDKVQPAKSTAVNSDGKKGMQWSIPHSLGPVRMEPDKNSSNVATLDCCFHPQTVELSLRSKQFKDLLVETAREACERGFMLVKDEVEIDKTYHMLKGVTYKNGEPAVMIMSKTKSKDSWASKNTKSQEILNAANNKLPDYTKPAAAKQEAAGTPAFQKGFMTAKKTTLKKKVEGADGKNVANGGGGVRGGGVNEDGQDVPEYTISEQGSFDISQQLTGGSANVTRPGSLILKIMLPRATTAADLDLDVSDTKLVMRSLPDSSSNYFLLVPLTYRCNGDKGKAKWDKKTKVLTVTIPVREPTAKEIEELTKKMESAGISVVAEKDAEEEEEEVEIEVKKLEEPKKEEKKKKKKESKREAFAVDEGAVLPVDNASAVQKFTTKTKSESEKPPPPPPTVAETVAVTGDFKACAEFDGRRAGYFFSTRGGETGYYAEAKKEKKEEEKREKEKKEKAPPKANADKEQKSSFYDNDKFEFRQSPTTITILIQVPSIDGDSVAADFEEAAVRVTYAVNGSSRTFQLDLAREVLPKDCTFDVATKNMVVILKKKHANVVWGQLEREAGKPVADGKVAAEAAKKEKAKKEKKAEKNSSAVNVDQNFSNKSKELMFDLD